MGAGPPLQKHRALRITQCHPFQFLLWSIAVTWMMIATQAAPVPSPSTAAMQASGEETGLEVDPNSTLAAMWESIYYQKEVEEDVVVLTVVEEMDEASGAWNRTLRNHTNGTR